jgi:hypothetical protein
MSKRRRKLGRRAVDRAEARTGRADSVADARYVGSAEHKRYPSPAGSPALRSDASECPPEIPYDDATSLLRDAIRASLRRGWHSALRDSRFPRYVWGFIEAGEPRRRYDFEARLTNRETGEYKAFPIDEAHDNDHLTEPLRRLIWPGRS